MTDRDRAGRRAEAGDGAATGDHRFRILFETEPECVKVLDPDGRLVEVNAAGLAMLEVDDLRQAKERPLLEYVEPEDRESFVGFLRDTLAGRSARLRFRLVGRLGTRRWMESTGAPLRDADGRVTGLIAVTRDITELLLAERELQRTAERDRLLFERNPQPMWVYDLETLAFLDVNEAAVRQYGWSRGEFLERTIRDVRPAEDVERLEENVARGDSGLTSSGLWRHRRRDGSVLDVEIVSSALDFSGRSARLVVALDVTDRLHAERALAESEARYRELVENLTEVVFELDPQGRITYLSPVVEAILGYRPEELIGRPFLSLIAPADRARTEAVVGKTLSGEPRPPNEYRVVARDGSLRWARSRARPIVRDGRVTGIRGIAVDITDLKRAQEELLAINEQLSRVQRMEAIGRLAGGIAHDFNNLLTVIGGHAEIAAQSLEEGSAILASIGEIREAARRATELTRQLLALGRRQVLRSVRIDLNQKLNEVERLFRRVLGEDIEIRLRPDPEPVEVVVDPGQIEQVIMNLVLNARDAMPSGGRLTIGTSRIELRPDSAARYGLLAGDYVELRVADTGRGIPVEIRHRLFEPFFTTKSPGRGSGLGLSTADGIVRQSGGAIAVTSQLGKGSVFSVLLPSAGRRDVAAIPAPGGDGAGQERIAACVLLIQSGDEMRAGARRALVGEGYSVIEAATGDRALETARELREEVDLVVCDRELPGVDFFDLLRRIRGRWPGARVVIVSESGPEPLSEAGLLSGVRFLQSPFSGGDLVALARSALSERGEGQLGFEPR